MAYFSQLAKDTAQSDWQDRPITERFNYDLPNDGSVEYAADTDIVTFSRTLDDRWAGMGFVIQANVSMRWPSDNDGAFLARALILGNPEIGASGTTCRRTPASSFPVIGAQRMAGFHFQMAGRFTVPPGLVQVRIRCQRQWRPYNQGSMSSRCQIIPCA